MDIERIPCPEVSGALQVSEKYYIGIPGSFLRGVFNQFPEAPATCFYIEFSPTRSLSAFLGVKKIWF
jgi:hypothetical protein